MAFLPPYLTRQILYSLEPELQTIDEKLAHRFSLRIMLTDVTKTTFYSELSNCTTLENLTNTFPNVVGEYITSLENSITSNSQVMSNTETFSLLEQKIKILEFVYSNVVSQSST
jgi:hypothetical protein